MFVTSNLGIVRTADTKVITIQYNGNTYVLPATDANYASAVDFYNKCRMTYRDDREKAILDGTIAIPTWLSGETVVTEPTPIDPQALLLEGLTALIDFFSEFEFTPSYRFTNTLATIAQKNKTSARNFVNRYFALMASSYADEVAQKVKSKEFDALLDKIIQYGTPATHVNNRFKVYYGAAGTGKTTLAQTETENRCIVCNASMLPADLMENFIFHDGKPDFDKSILWECMEEGKPIVLDEINLLPFDSLRFLQGVADGKTSFIYKNREVQIADGFKIIGTMNLSLGGVTYGLPEPLVDRCEDIREFELSPKQLLGAITGNYVAG